MGDIVFQLISFSFMLGLVAGIVFLIINLKKRSSKLDRVEKKVDQLLERKESQSDR
ncbi:DUF4083 domain-containing protein [Pseudalkalibacillus hwajinpoensis]|uniref:DUF4083 domain-containing protein n=1 Tax=Guptibacillus hwajinpoensis TaxID=208199 RepID=UPI001CD5396A|nr:DUF4083 domain-containing protein [Pseudalkalibacillus hwajinpoensis]MCA0993327.1 DUF4083 domain-containing protein [Pseudalkalibacillus hwajinpoensis]